MIQDVIELAKSRFPNIAYFTVTMNTAGDIKTAFGMPKGMRNSDLLGMIEVGKNAHLNRFFAINPPKESQDEKRYPIEDGDEDKNGSPI